MTEIKDVSILVKWNGKEYPITDLSDQETVAVLKHEIARLTNVKPERQKLLNLRYKGEKIKRFSIESTLMFVNLQESQRLMISN